MVTVMGWILYTESSVCIEAEDYWAVHADGLIEGDGEVAAFLVCKERLEAHFL